MYSRVLLSAGHALNFRLLVSALPLTVKRGLNRERGSFLLAANSRQSAQLLVIQLRIQGAENEERLSNRTLFSSLRKIYFCTHPAAIHPRHPADTWASSAPTQHHQSQADTIFKAVSDTNTLKSRAGLRPLLWASVGFGARRDDVTRKAGIIAMCQCVSMSET